MNRKILIILVSVSVVVILAIVLTVIFIYPSLYKKNLLQTGPTVPVKQTNMPSLPTPEQQLELIKKNYPQVITGVIKFFDTKTSFKATLTTDKGVEYLLWPAQPEGVYESFGAKNGGRVQVNGKPAGSNKLLWALMRPI